MEAATVFTGEDLDLDLDLEGVAARSISGSRRLRRGKAGGGRGNVNLKNGWGRWPMGLDGLGFGPFGAHSPQ